MWTTQHRNLRGTRTSLLLETSSSVLACSSTMITSVRQRMCSFGVKYAGRKIEQHVVEPQGLSPRSSTSASPGTSTACSARGSACTGLRGSSMVRAGLEPVCAGGRVSMEGRQTRVRAHNTLYSRGPRSLLGIRGHECEPLQSAPEELQQLAHLRDFGPVAHSGEERQGEQAIWETRAP